MKYYKDLYIGESIKEKKDEILEKLETNTIMLQLYVITLTKSEQNQLEFMKSLLWRESADKEKLLIVGLAGNYEEAVYLIEKITKEVYAATKGANIRKYICDRQA